MRRMDVLDAVKVLEGPSRLIDISNKLEGTWLHTFSTLASLRAAVHMKLKDLKRVGMVSKIDVYWTITPKGILQNPLECVAKGLLGVQAPACAQRTNGAIVLAR